MGGPTLREKLEARRFVVSVEMDPPRGLGTRRVLEGAALFKEAGVDCLNVGDSPMAQLRMSAVAMGALIQQKASVEVIVHFTTRDRNLMALQADLLGAHALGVRNIVALKGDPHVLGKYDHATAVWDVGAVGLIKILKGFNEGKNSVGDPIGRSASFLIGAVANPTAEKPEAELRLFRQKVAAGAQFFITQAVYDIKIVRRFVEAVAPLKVPLILGVLPLQNHRHAEFLHHQVPGIVVPEEVRERLHRAGEEGPVEGLAIAKEFLSQVRGLVQGVCFMPAFGRYDGIAELVKSAKG